MSSSSTRGPQRRTSARVPAGGWVRWGKGEIEYAGEQRDGGSWSTAGGRTSRMRGRCGDDVGEGTGWGGARARAAAAAVTSSSCRPFKTQRNDGGTSRRRRHMHRRRTTYRSSRRRAAFATSASAVQRANGRRDVRRRIRASRLEPCDRRPLIALHVLRDDGRRRTIVCRATRRIQTPLPPHRHRGPSHCVHAAVRRRRAIQRPPPQPPCTRTQYDVIIPCTRRSLILSLIMLKNYNNDLITQIIR